MKKMENKDIISQLLRFCAYQDRFEVEVVEKLKDIGVEEKAEQEKVLAYLRDEKFIDESRAAKSYARGKILLKKWSKFMVSVRLKVLKVSHEHISEALDEIDEEEYRKIVKKKLKEQSEKNKKLHPKLQKQKALNLMKAKGFEFELMIELWEEMQEEGLL